MKPPKRLLLVMLGFIIIAQGVTAQEWTTHEVVPPGSGHVPVGASVETHPLTNAWVVLGAYDNTTTEFSEVRAVSSYDAFATTNNDFTWGDVRDQTEITIGGLSTSYTGMIFCLTQLYTESGQLNAQLDLVWQTGNDYTDWNRAVILEDDDPTNATGEGLSGENDCDTALPRHGWRTPPSTELTWITNLDIENNVRYVSLEGEAGQIIGQRDVTLAGGSNQLHIDSAENLIEPGTQFEPTFLIRDQITEPSENCPLDLWWLGCAIAKQFDHWAGADVFQDQSTPQQATVDWHTRVVSCGVVQNTPNNERGVFSRENTFLQPNISGEEKIASSTANIQSCTVAAMDHWSHIVMWQQPETSGIRMRETSLGTGGSTIHEAFTHDNRIREMRVKAVDAHRSGTNLIGVIRDNQSDVYALWSDDRGRSWNKTLVASDFDDNTKGAGYMIDTAYDPHREQQLIVYTTANNVTLAVRDLSFGVPPVRAPQDLRGLFEVEQEEPETATFLGIPMQPVADETGWTTNGSLYFMAFLLMYALIAGIWVCTKSPLLSLLGGGGLGLMMSFAFGAIEFWVIFVLGILVAGGMLFLANTFTGIGQLGELGGRFGGGGGG